MTSGNKRTTNQYPAPSSKLLGLLLTLLLAKMFGPVHFGIGYLQVDDHDERGRRDHSEGLVIGWRLSVLTHRLQKSSVRDEEDEEGGEDAVKEADEEVPVIKQRPLLAREIQLRKAQTQFVVHVLRVRHKRNIRVGMPSFLHRGGICGIKQVKSNVT